MSNEKKGELITSVKSGNGLKILSGLEARAKMDSFGFDSLYYLDIDYKTQAQADYMQEKYGNEYSYGNNEYMEYWGCVNAETDNQKTGSFITTDKMLFKNLVYHFINDEKMTVSAWTKKFTNSYNPQEDWSNLLGCLVKDMVERRNKINTECASINK